MVRQNKEKGVLNAETNIKSLQMKKKVKIKDTREKYYSL